MILMMEDGRIVESGTHEELIALRGSYADLYNSQFAGPEVDPEPRKAPRTGHPAAT